MKIERQTLCRNWDCTTGVVHSRKHSRFDCIDRLSKNMIPQPEREREREREREKVFLGLSPNLENRGSPENKGKTEEGEKERQRERERRERKGEIVGRFFLSPSFRERRKWREEKRNPSTGLLFFDVWTANCQIS